MAKSVHLVANWKMALGISESAALAQTVVGHVRPAHVALTLAPSFPSLPAVAEALKKSTVALGAQNVSADAPGAHTGEVSLDQLRELGVQWVILGHSERRSDQHVTDAEVARTVASALRAGVAPILCVGETAEQRSANRHVETVLSQLNAALERLRPPFSGMPFAVAYEPVWAIGTGIPIEPSQAADMLRVLKQRIADLVAPPFRAGFTVLYGGSVDADNVQDFVGDGRFDGALVGTASQSAAALLPLIDRIGAQ